MILKKASKDGKCGITLSSTSNAVGHTFVEAMAAGGPAAASHKVFVGDLVLAVNSVPCEGCSSGCRVMREADGEVRLLIRAKISDHGYGDCAKFTIPSHTRGVDRTVEFKDYAPQVFRKIRALFGVPEREYMMSLGPEQVRNSDAIRTAIDRNSAQFSAISDGPPVLLQILGELLLGTMGSLSELFSEGKSGSFFYFSNDAYVT